MAGQSRTARPSPAAAPSAPASIEAGEEVAVPTMSPSMRQFAPAFVKVQLALRPVVKNAQNPHFQNNFADLAAILEEALPLLNNNGFCLMQFPATLGNQLALLSILMHESGEFISSTMPLLLQKSDPQGEGSAITYGRRYAACAILGIRTADDDGNAASERQPAQRPDGPARRPARDQPKDEPPQEDAYQPKEGWATAEAEAAAHKAAIEQIKQLYAIVGEDHPIRKTLTGYRELNGWPMPATALMQLSMLVAKAHGEAVAAQEGGPDPDPPDSPPQTSAPAPEAPSAPVAPSERMPWDGVANPAPDSLSVCPWCEKEVEKGTPSVITGGTRSDDPAVRYHKGCYDEREAEANEEDTGS